MGFNSNSFSFLLSELGEKKGSTAKDYAQKLASGDIAYADVKSFADKIKIGSTGANFLDDVATEVAKSGAFSADIAQLYRDASVNYNADYSGAFKTPDESQRMYKQSSAAAGDKTKLASRAGSSVPKASVTATTAEATKRTISGL